MDQINFKSRVLGPKAADRLKIHQVTQTLRSPSAIAKVRSAQVEVTLDGHAIGLVECICMDAVYWHELDIDDARRGGFDNRFELASALKRAGYRFKSWEEYSWEEYKFYRIKFAWLENQGELSEQS